MAWQLARPGSSRRWLANYLPLGGLCLLYCACSRAQVRLAQFCAEAVPSALRASSTRVGTGAALDGSHDSDDEVLLDAEVDDEAVLRSALALIAVSFERCAADPHASEVAALPITQHNITQPCAQITSPHLAHCQFSARLLTNAARDAGAGARRLHRSARPRPKRRRAA